MFKNKKSILLVVIILLAAFLRLYRISDYMTFLGDEGRDVIIVKEILEGNFTLLGPRSSAGDFYTGPIYYYMMVPFLWLFRLDPVGPAVMIALLGVATVWLVYFVGKKLFNQQVGLMAAAMYTVSPLVIAYSRSSWNPNAMPFFTLLLLYLLYCAVKSRSWKYFLGVGFLYGIVLQLHYIELFVGMVIFCFTLFSYFYLKRKNILQLFKQYGILLLGFVTGFSPFLVFELIHNFLNTRAIFSLILHGSPNALDLTNKTFIEIVQDVFFRVFARTLWNYPTPDLAEALNKNLLAFWQVIIIVMALGSIVLILKYKDRLAAAIMGMWLLFGIVLFGFYKKPINDYNFEFLFPLPFLLTAYLIYRIYTNKKFSLPGKGLAILLFIFLFGYNLWHLPFRNEPNKQKNQIKSISEFVISKTLKKPYNFALIASGNSDHAYRYYLDILNHPPISIENTILDPSRKTAMKQLLVICEDEVCKPEGHPLFEIAGFGQALIAAEWRLPHVRVYKLVPNNNSSPK